MAFDFFHTQIISLNQLKESLQDDAQQPRDLVTILEDHHDYIEESIKVLMDPKASVEDKRTNLTRFITVLDMHSKAEEETLYVALQANEDKFARVEGLGGRDDHDLAKQVVEEIKALHYEDTWTDEVEAKAMRVASMVQTHITEEEKQMFKVAKKQISNDKLDMLAKDYIQKCRTYLDTEVVAAQKKATTTSNQFSRH